MDKKDLKDEKLLYNVRETAAVLGVNVHLVYELINRKLLPALRLGSLKVRKQTDNFLRCRGLSVDEIFSRSLVKVGDFAVERNQNIA